VGGEDEYAFLHALVRDVAYGQIPRAARAEKHRAAAAWISALSGDRLEDRSELLAHHYLSALELARAAGIDTTDLELPARLALRSAGERAMSLGAYAAAGRAYGSAAELWPADDPERPRLLLELGRALTLDRDAGVEVLTEAEAALLAAGDVDAAAVAKFLIGNTTWRLGHGEEAREHYERAAAMLEGRPPSLEVAQGMGFLATYLMVSSRSREAIRIGREALAIAEQVGAEDIRAQTLNSVGTARINLGDLGGFDDLRESIAVAEASTLPFHVSRGYVNLGVSHFYAGDVRQALEAHRRGFEIVSRYGIESGIIWTKAEVAFDLFMLGRWDESLEIVDAEIARIEAGAPHYLEVQHRQTRARIRIGRGDADGALADADRGVEIGREAQDAQALLPALAERARILLQVGRREEAAAGIEEVLATMGPEGVPEPVMDWTWWMVPAAVVLTDLGRADELLALGGEEVPSRWIRAARRWAMGDLPGAADLFDTIGAAVEEAAARRLQAERLIADGRRAEAEPFLARALEMFREMGATAYLQQAERLLAPPA
jgi:tetratricopeptide (TPR) repeat protein